MIPPRILLTGGTGFLGRHLLRRLIGTGHRVVLLKRRASVVDGLELELSRTEAIYNADNDALPAIFEKHRIDLVLHCATNYGRGNAEPTEIIEANLTLPLQLLQYGKKHGIRGFINSDTILDKQVNHYSLSKRQFVDWLEYFREDVTCVNVALEHFYGPGDDPSKFVTWVIRQLLARTPRIDLTPGDQKRDFIYIDDVVEAYLHAIRFACEAPPGVTRLEVGSGTAISVRRFVELCKTLASADDTQLRFGVLPYRQHEVMLSRADVSELSRLGWSPTVSLEEGLRKTIDIEIATQRETMGS